MEIGALKLSLPLLVLAATMTIVLLRFYRTDAISQGRAAFFSALGQLGALIALFLVWPRDGATASAFGGMLAGDGLGILASALCLGCGLVSAAALTEYLRERAWNLAEIQVLMLLAVAGMLVMVCSHHLAVIFLGLEVMSLSLYVLTAAMRDKERAVEAGTKYFLTGAFASGLLLMGIALLYGMTGSLDLRGIQAILEGVPGEVPPLVLVGWLMVIAGLGFKIAAVPFHQWVPDVYEGAPTPVTGFMSTAVKVAGFTALVRFVEATSSAVEVGPGLFGALGVLTMVVGNVGALAQRSVKRMLAYSSVAHGGYLLLGVAALAAGGGEVAKEGIFVYLAAYALMNIGAFAVLGMIEARDGSGLEFPDLHGLRHRHPGLAVAMLIFMISLAGIPPTGGFLGKLELFVALTDRVAQQGDAFFGFLAVMLALNSVIGLGYYLRVVMDMFTREESEGRTVYHPAWPRVINSGLVAVCALLVLWIAVGPDIFGIGAGGLLDWVQGALG